MPSNRIVNRGPSTLFVIDSSCRQCDDGLDGMGVSPGCISATKARWWTKNRFVEEEPRSRRFRISFVDWVKVVTSVRNNIRGRVCDKGKLGLSSRTAPSPKDKKVCIPQRKSLPKNLGAEMRSVSGELLKVDPAYALHASVAFWTASSSRTSRPKASATPSLYCIIAIRPEVG